MQTLPCSFRYWLTALTSLVGLAATAHALTVIDSLPYTISSSGTYVLDKNLSSTQSGGSLITVNASNVTIDFQSHYIAGPTVSSNQSIYGIFANERSNLTIKNGTIAYCQIGIGIIGNGDPTTNNVNHRIDRMRLTYCSFVGILIHFGPASRITNCQVSQFGTNAQTLTYGIAVEGDGTTVQGNVVSAIAGLPSYGIYAEDNNFIRRNTVSNAYRGINGGKYQDNLTSGCTMPFSSGVNAGGNN